MTLGVKLRDDARFDNFHGDRNAAAATRLQQGFRDAGSIPVTVLCGASDTGKSHLLQAACHETERRGKEAICVSIGELLPFGAEALTGLERAELVCLDDLDLIAGKPDWEEAVFHLYNRILDQRHQLMVSLSNVPGHLPFGLRDLVSRLQHGLLIQLGIYRDEDRMTILRARAEQRGLVLADDVATFVLRRAPRKLGELLAILDRLDENSLQAQRKLTIPFIKDVMGW
ncbi:DnaA regulatory inactivator Hda [Marinobacter zhejiangensis]|uniref:Regulatory inactivation of DnaA Hda protein n=1 Tax=Marinobacter zhejiangensis TaxID=488535 RepID=A0A1I4RCK2_9GAMM|nr:DnaA regulatory inactivator Hda [Marinobacter zhejiangensis]SFM49766.1 regulatory inactivation of DnaA Hda protein [Marinobacter zhejiangensis]